VGAKIALVLGNAQYCGYPVPVDDLTVELGEQLQLKLERLLTVRYRRNSAQQMRIFGRNSSRESAVIFAKSPKTRSSPRSRRGGWFFGGCFGR